MAGETVKSEAVCVDIRPWSQTSHIVTWLTPQGRVGTVVRGAERPKSFFLGAYDFNYTCEIVYYARARGDLHALRECSPLSLRERLRGDYRALALADYFRRLAVELAPNGPDAGAWYETLSRALDRLADGLRPDAVLSELLAYELETLRLAGLHPDFTYPRDAGEWASFSVESGRFTAGESGRAIRISRETAEYLTDLRPEKNLKIPLDATRVIGVFYHFHLDCASEARRSLIRLIS